MTDTPSPLIRGFFRNKLARALIIPTVAGVFLSILSPFGTAALSVPFRLVYWVGLTLAGGIGATLSMAVWARFWPQTFWQKGSLILRGLFLSLGATLAVAPFVLGAPGVLGMTLDGNLPHLAITLFYIWVISVAIIGVETLAARRHGTAAATPARPILLERLPPKFRDAALYAISSEDHYIRVHSAVGEHMMLMRLSDAEDLSAPLVGLKPHRSWWVAETGVQNIRNREGKLSIELKSGAEVPVSRAGAKRIRAAGWI